MDHHFYASYFPLIFEITLITANFFLDLQTSKNQCQLIKIIICKSKLFQESLFSEQTVHWYWNMATQRTKNISFVSYCTKYVLCLLRERKFIENCRRITIWHTLFYGETFLKYHSKWTVYYFVIDENVHLFRFC